jgi:hypothetical protein
VPHQQQPNLIRCWTALALLAGVLLTSSRAGASDPLNLPPPPEVAPPTEATIRLALTPADLPVRHPRGRSLYLDMLTREAERRGLPPAVADAVAMVESAYFPGAVGGVGEIGLMQVLPSTATMLGFRGTLAELSDPETNIRYGVTYLAEAWRMTGGQLCETLMKYRAGHGEERMSQRSVDYCARARLHLAAIGSPLANAPVPRAVADAVVSLPGGLGRRGLRRGPARLAARANPIRRSIWAAHDARFKAIQSKLSSASLRIMQ